MGIPSYFRHLLHRYPRLLTAARPEQTTCSILLVDFNCLIYGCVRSGSLPPYSHATRHEWENALLEEIKRYVVRIWTTAGKPSTVLLAVDGVVPMAKIRQQRLRRFKSVWMGAKERELGVRSPTDETWDTNSITPGTEFMERLSGALRQLCEARGSGWMFSGAEEPGEGEQKLMAWVRSRAADIPTATVAVYGLDADLILLCLLHAASVAPQWTWNILRETQEFGGSNTARAYAQQEFLYLSISGLLEEFVPHHRRDAVQTYMLDYVCGMSLLGNDFLPHALSIHHREGGHDRLRLALEELYTEGRSLTMLNPSGCWAINTGSLQSILTGWADTEVEDIRTSFQSKYSHRMFTPRSETERMMMPVQNLPLEWKEEGALWNFQKRQLYDDWRTRYSMNGSEIVPTQEDIQHRAHVYLQGLQWILDYYTGQRPVSFTWLYPWNLPPLWSELLTALRDTQTLTAPPDPTLDGTPLTPQEHLALVLPLESWNLIRLPHLKSCPSRLPAFWPSKFAFHSLGRRWIWECEPRIPFLTAARLRWV